SKFGVSMPRYHARCHAACWGTVWSVPDSDRQGEMRSEVGWGRCPAGSPGIPGLNAPGSLAFALYTSTSDPVPTSDGDEHGAPRVTCHMAHGTWHMAHGTWHMAHGKWHMAHGTWHAPPLSPSRTGAPRATQHAGLEGWTRRVR